MNYQNTQPVMLEMVNTALDATGYGMVQSLDATPIVQTLMYHMHVARKRFLLNSNQGWTWNVMDLQVSQDVNGHTLIPDNILYIVSDNPNLTKKQGKLYDARTNSFTNINYTELQGIVLLDYEDLPVLVQEYISYMAAYKVAMGDAFSQADRTEIFQNAEIILTQINTDEIGRMANEEHSQSLDNPQDFSYLTRRMNNNKL